jgi:hypothetical protein
MSARWLVLCGLLASANAFAGGGGGITATFDYLPRYGSGDQAAPGALGCFGGVGFGARSDGLRIGGEAAFCRGRPGVALSYGGAQIGYHRAVGPVWWSAHSGIGFGSTRDRSSFTGNYSAIFAYLRPELSVGFTWGVTAMEFGVNVMAPLNLVQWVGQGEPRGFITPMPGAQVSFLLGDFRERVRSAPTPQAPTADGWPLAIPGPSTPHDGAPPADQPQAQQDPGEQRLAIPADEPPPREAPPAEAPLAVPFDQAPPPP